MKGFSLPRACVGLAAALSWTANALAADEICSIVAPCDAGVATAASPLSPLDSIGPGETLALVGPSGSGKSTLVALLAGLMRPSAGRVNIGTYDMGKLSDSEIARLRGTEIGVVLQGAARNLLPYATLHRNIWLAQRRAARTEGIKLDDPDRILDLVGLPGLGRSRIEELANVERDLQDQEQEEP